MNNLKPIGKPRLSLFSHARTALWQGLCMLQIDHGQSVLVPDYVCDAALHPMEELGICPVFYPVDDTFNPDWEALEDIHAATSVQAVMMIHYFGQPQDIHRFQDFCHRHRLWLIEDNSHGHGGTLDGKFLGTFGDLGISSPRKQLSAASGGILYLKGVLFEDIPVELPTYPAPSPMGWGRRQLRRQPRLEAWFRRRLRDPPNFSDPRAFPETRIDRFGADAASVALLDSIDWVKHAAIRREAWQAWSRFAMAENLRPVWPAVHPESCPWVLPVVARTTDERDCWLRRGWNNGQNLFSWPTLPEPVLQSRPSVVERWRLLLCFPLDRFPPQSIA